MFCDRLAHQPNFSTSKMLTFYAIEKMLRYFSYNRILIQNHKKEFFGKYFLAEDNLNQKF